MDYPNNSRGDVEFWCLSPARAAHHHSRLSRMYANRATMLAQRSRHYADQAQKVSIAAAVLALIALANLVVALVTR